MSINLAPKERGKGYGTRILTDGIEALLAAQGTVRVVAEVKTDNAASLRIFHRCRFTERASQDGWKIMIRSNRGHYLLFDHR